MDVGYPATTHSMMRTEDRVATMGVAGDPFSVTSQTNTTTLSAAELPDSVFKTVYSAGPPATVTTTTAEGRQVRLTLDALERVTHIAVLGTQPVAIAPAQIQYDARGRVV